MVHVYITQEPRLFCGLLSLSPKLMSRTRFVMQALYQCSITDKYHNSMAYAYAGVELRSWLFFSLPECCQVNSLTSLVNIYLIVYDVKCTDSALLARMNQGMSLTADLLMLSLSSHYMVPELLDY